MFNKELLLSFLMFHPGISIAVFILMAFLSRIYKVKIFYSFTDFLNYWILRPFFSFILAFSIIVALRKLGFTPLVQMYSFPFLFQVLFLFITFDLFASLLHKALHSVRIYDFHKKHHSISVLSWENSAKESIVFELSNCIFLGFLVFFFAISQPAILTALFLWKTSLALTHFNKPIKLGFLENIITSPYYHEEHHHEATQNKDIAISLRIWNRLFN